MMKFCSIDGCVQAVKTGGLCSMHYSRARRHGDPLKTVKPANGVVQKYFQEIVMQYDGDDCLIWPYCRDRHGYAQMSNPTGTAIVARRVCEEAHGAPTDQALQAAHSCGKGHLGCVTKRHVSWKTKSENEADKLAHGTDRRGERKTNQVKIREADVAVIRSLRGELTQREIGAQFGITPQTVSGIQLGKSWRWLNV